MDIPMEAILVKQFGVGAPIEDEVADLLISVGHTDAGNTWVERFKIRVNDNPDAISVVVVNTIEDSEIRIVGELEV